MLGFLTNPTNEKYNRVDLPSRVVGERYKGSPETLPADIRTFRPAMLTGNARRIADLIWSVGIAYNYNLEMTENNNNDGALNLVNILPTSNRTFGFSSKLDLERQNTRIFTITDTLGSLVAETPAYYCGPRYVAEGENFIYPLTGRIGMERVIQEFVVMAIFDNLSDDRTKDFTKADGPSQLSEQLQFTTTIDVSTTPKVTFTPVGVGLHVADASFRAQAIRKDLHKLTVGLYVPKATPLDAIRGGILGGLSPVPFGTLASAPVRNRAEVGALAAVNQALALQLFQRRLQVIVQ
ncbi:MAG: hypothetical protein MIL41_00450 [Hyphomicrobiales bacterium]